MGRQQSERTSVSSGTHSVKRERAEPRGLGVRTESARAQNFCLKSKRTEVPSGTPLSVRERAKIEVNFVGPPTLPFSCSAKRHCKFESTQRQSLDSGISAALAWQSSLSCARVPSWPQYDLLGRGTVLLGYYYLSVPFRFLPRLFLCSGSCCFPCLPLVSSSFLQSYFSTLLLRREELFIWSAVVALGLGGRPERTILLQASPRRRLVEPERTRRRAVSSRSVRRGSMYSPPFVLVRSFMNLVLPQLDSSKYR